MFKEQIIKPIVEGLSALEESIEDKISRAKKANVHASEAEDDL